MLANPERGEVEIRVGDDVYVLKLSMRAARQVQKRNQGKTVGELLMAAQRLDYNMAGELMFALLQEFHAADFPTMKEVDALLDRAGGIGVFFDYCEASEKIEALRKAAQAPKVDGAPENPQTAQAGTGGSSGLQLAASA